MTTDRPDEADAEPTDDHLIAESVRTFPWSTAALAAAGVFVVEYLIMTAIFVLGPSSVDRSAAPITSEVAVLAQYGHILFNAHHVPTITRATVPIANAPIANDLYLASGASVPPAVFFLVPVVALVAGGLLFERSRGTARSESVLEESALVGTGFTVGYLACGVLGALLFVQRWPLVEGGETVGTLSQGPMLGVTLVTFFLFPMLFVTLGAAVAHRVGSPTESPTTVPESDPAVPAEDDQA